ncbi:3442_t:CDS:2, partial [Funneliformis geosporum]
MNPFDKIKMDYNQFLQSASYLESISQIIDDSYRPNFPPDIIIEEFVTRFDRKKRISENRGNAFIVIYGEQNQKKGKNVIRLIPRKQLLGDDKINKRQHPDDDDVQPQNHKSRISTIEGQNPIDD